MRVSVEVEGTGKLMILNWDLIIEIDGEQQVFDYAACN